MKYLSHSNVIFYYFIFKNTDYEKKENGGFVNSITSLTTTTLSGGNSIDSAKIWQQIDIIFKNVAKIYEKEAKVYSNTVNGFYIFSADFMITSDNVVKMLEINDMTGINFRDEKIKLEFDKHLIFHYRNSARNSKLEIDGETKLTRLFVKIHNKLCNYLYGK